MLQMSVAEAKEACQNWWMKEALDEFVHRQTQPQQKEEQDEAVCTQTDFGFCSINFLDDQTDVGDQG